MSQDQLDAAFSYPRIEKPENPCCESKRRIASHTPLGKLGRPW